MRLRREQKRGQGELFEGFAPSNVLVKVSAAIQTQTLPCPGKGKPQGAGQDACPEVSDQDR